MAIETDPNIIAVFGPPPPGVDLAESEVTGNAVAVVVLLGIATIAVMLRFIARASQRTGLMADDWFVIFALLFVGATTGLSIAGGASGAGKHVWAVTLPGLTRTFKILYTYTFLYIAACSTTKVSVILFYRRLFVSSTSGWFLRWSIISCLFVAISYPIIIWVTLVNCCRPVSFYWTQFSGTKGECIDVETFFLALGIICMVSDIMVLAVGFPPVLTLQMSKRKKAAVCSILLLGSFVFVASIVRIYYLSEFSKATDVTWLMGPVFIWSSIEPSIGIVCACLPHLGPLAKTARKKISSSFGSSKTPSSYPSTHWQSKSHTGPSRHGSQKGTGTGTGAGTLFGFRRGATEAESDDEIELTNYVMAAPKAPKENSLGSVSEENIRDQYQHQQNDLSIVVQSSFVQSVSRS